MKRIKKDKVKNYFITLIKYFNYFILYLIFPDSINYLDLIQKLQIYIYARNQESKVSPVTDLI